MKRKRKTLPILYLVNELFCRFSFGPCVSARLCSGVSHSVTSDMHMIEQENTLGSKTTKGRRLLEPEDDEGSFTSRSDEEPPSTFPSSF